MTDLRKAAEMALYGLLDARQVMAITYNDKHAYQDEIEALRQALAQPEQKHKPWCDYLNIMLTSLPPQKAKCNCKQAQSEHPLDKKADNARELGLDYEPEICYCESIQRCTMFDRCMKHDKE